MVGFYLLYEMLMLKLFLFYSSDEANPSVEMDSLQSIKTEVQNFGFWPLPSSLSFFPGLHAVAHIQEHVCCLYVFHSSVGGLGKVF